MGLVQALVPGRHGWVLGDTAVDGERVVVLHVESHHRFWAWGSTYDERLENAQRQIDALLEHRWAQLAALIEEDDHAGPHVRLVGSPDAIGVATS